MKEVIWQNKHFSVVDEKTTDGHFHCLKMIDSGFVNDGTYLQYNEITKQIWWHFKTKNYQFLPVETSVIKNAIRQCPDEEMLDFTTNTIWPRWCMYLKDVNYSIGSMLTNYIPWPFIIAIIKLLLEEIYNEG